MNKDLPATGIPVGISRCLLGEPVRYNGGHKRSAVCPEVEIGLGVPREPIRLVDGDKGLRARGSDGERDHTAALTAAGERFGAAHSDLCGFIFTQKSPSCGLFRVKVYHDNGQPSAATGRGIFASAITQANPLLPAEEAGRLNDATLRDNFLTRVFAYYQWRQLVQRGASRRGIIAFYSRYKYLMLAHHQPSYRSIGRLLARAGLMSEEDLAQRFIQAFMTGLSHPATRKQITNALEHMRGHLKRDLGSAEKSELGDLLEHYRRGHLPLIAPLVLLRHHLQQRGDAYVCSQTLLAPFPDELQRV